MSDTRKIPADKLQATSRTTSTNPTTFSSTLENPRVDNDRNGFDRESHQQVNEVFEATCPQQSPMASYPRSQHRECLDQEDCDFRPRNPQKRKATSSKQKRPLSSSSRKQKNTEALSSSKTNKVAPPGRSQPSLSSPNNKKTSGSVKPVNGGRRVRSNIENDNQTSDANCDEDDYSLSTAPAPPSLRIRPHYTLRPGAYRMSTGGVARYVSAESDDDIDNYSYHNTVNTSTFYSGSVEDESIPLPPPYRPTTSEGYSFSGQRGFENTRTGNPYVQGNSGPIRDRHGRNTDIGFRGETSTMAIEGVPTVDKDDAITITFFNKRKVLIMTGILVLVVVLASAGAAYGQKRFDRTGETDSGIQVEDDIPSPSLPPSLSSSEMASFIKELPAYTKESLKIENSPQSKSIEWMLRYDDTEKFTLPRQLQRFALIALYFSITSRDPSHELLSYLANSEECMWFNSTCEENMYKELFLPSSTVWRGTIVPELALLSSLERLRIDPNALVGVIPSELGQITTLKEFQINGNLLRGTIPTEFGKLSNLEHIDLCDNLLSGSIPVEIDSWSKVRTFALANNTFVGMIPPEIGQMNNLITFSASSNQLSGELPLEIRQLERLERFNVQNNYLSGEVLSKFAYLGHTLKKLHLRSNEFSGKISSTIGLLTNLVVFDMSKNKLEGAIPTEIGLMTSLTRLQFFSNSLQYTLPKELQLLTNLESMALYNNQFTGAVPMEICELTATCALLPDEFIVDCEKLICWCCSCPP